MIHDVKILKPFADAILSDQKRFEIRKNDRGYQKGDFLRFLVIDEKGNTVPHPLSGQRAKILYVLSDWGLRPGYVALSITRW